MRLTLIFLGDFLKGSCFFIVSICNIIIVITFLSIMILKSNKKSIIAKLIILYLVKNIVCQGFSDIPTENSTQEQKIGSCMISFSIQNQSNYRFIKCMNAAEEYANWQNCCNNCCSQYLIAFTKDSFENCRISQMKTNQLSPAVIGIISGCLLIGLIILACCLKKYFFQEIRRQSIQKKSRLGQAEKQLITTSIYKEKWISTPIPKNSSEIIDTDICIQEKNQTNCRICLTGPALLELDCSCKYHIECIRKQADFTKNCFSCQQSYHFVRRFCRRCQIAYLLVAKEFFYKNEQELSKACQNCAEDENLSFRVKHSFSELKL